VKNIPTLSLLLIIFFAPYAEADNQTDYEKAMISMMFEEINKSVNENYDFKGVQFTDGKILELKMTDGLSFIITIQISTFIGAHNIIGIDQLKFKRELDGLKLVNYEHTPSEYKEEILRWYFNKTTQLKS